MNRESENKNFLVRSGETFSICSCCIVGHETYCVYIHSSVLLCTRSYDISDIERPPPPPGRDCFLGDYIHFYPIRPDQTPTVSNCLQRRLLARPNGRGSSEYFPPSFIPNIYSSITKPNPYTTISLSSVQPSSKAAPSASSTVVSFSP